MVKRDFSEVETFKLRPQDGQQPAMGRVGRALRQEDDPGRAELSEGWDTGCAEGWEVKLENWHGALLSHLGP